MHTEHNYYFIPISSTAKQPVAVIIGVANDPVSDQDALISSPKTQSLAHN